MKNRQLKEIRYYNNGKLKGESLQCFMKLDNYMKQELVLTTF